jgi:C-terminal processing protease CtpA/Prc
MMKRVLIFTAILILVTMITGKSAYDPVEKQKIIMVKEKGKFALGVLITKVEEEVLKAYGLDGGAEIKKVLDDSEAERIGLKKGDIIVKFASQHINEPSQIRKIVSDIEEQGEVEIVVNRDGKKKTFKATLNPMDPQDIVMNFDGGDIELEGIEKMPKIIKKRMWHHDRKGGFLGVHTKDLSEQLQEYFEVENGVLIEKVIEDSPADKAGFQAGDVITEINDKKVEDYDDLVRILNFYDPEDKVKIKYSRKGKMNNVEVVLGKKEHPEFHLDWHGDMHEEVFEDLEDEMKILKEKLPKISEDVKDGLKDLKIEIEMYFI